jgi:hypothetical protein
MKRVLAAGALLLALSACQSAERAPVEPLPPRDQPVAYEDMVQRAWSLARNADDALYVDNWTKLTVIAVDLQNTAKRLPKATDVPANQKDDALPQRVDALAKASDRLLTHAQEQKVKEATLAIRDIHNAVYALKPARPDARPMDKEPPPPKRP